MEQNKEYFAFISYQRQDEDWAKWLADQLEHYHLPLTLNGRDDLPKDLRPIFRDIDELAAGNLPQQIYQALKNSKNLIVVCSPNSAKSPWVNKEVETYIGMGKLDNIFPFIIDGVPFSKNKDEECLPEALRKLSDDKERLGANVKEYKDGPQRLCKDCPLPKDDRDNKKLGNINEKGRDAAVVKIVAGMLGLGFDTLWQRYEKEKAEEERKIKEQQDKLFLAQSRFLIEKTNDLLGDGNFRLASLLSLCSLPRNIANPERPFIKEAENALRMSTIDKSPIIPCSFMGDINSSHKLIATVEPKGLINLWDAHTGTLIKKIDLSHILPEELDSYQKNHTYFSTVLFANLGDGEQIIVSTKSEMLSSNNSQDFTNSCAYVVDINSNKAELLFKESSEGFTFTSIFVSPKKKYAIFKTVMDGSFGLSSQIYVYEIATKRILYKFSDRKVSTSFSHNDNYIAFASGHSLHIMDVNDNSFPYKYCFYDIIECHFCNDGTDRILFLCSDNAIRIWSYKSEVIEVVYQFDSKIEAFLVDRNMIVISSAIGLSLIDCNISRIINTKVINAKHSIISFSKENGEVVYTYGNSIRIWDINFFNGNKLLYYHPDTVILAKFCQNYTIVVSVSNNCIIFWDVNMRKEIGRYEIDTNGIETNIIERMGCEDIIISPNNHMIVYQDIEGINLLDIHNNTTIKIQDHAPFLCLSNDESNLLIPKEDGFYLYDIINKIKGRVFLLPDGQFVFGTDSFVFSPDDNLIISINADEDPDLFALNIWNATTGEHLNTISSEKIAPTDSIIFTDNNCVLLNNSFLWNYKNNNLRELEEFERLTIKEMSRDYELITDGVCVLLKTFIPLQQLIDETYERLSNCPLTPEECRKYYLD